jgi:ATP-dependent RNA helicase DHX29
MALQAFSFKTKDIEDAMTNTLLHGGDLHSALDWLCLNLSDGKQYCHSILLISKTF